jgi:hypothetical protein
MPTDSADVRGIRLAKNQALFRSVNERVAIISRTVSTFGRLEFMCECGIHECGQYVELTREEFEAVRLQPTHFFVLPGHVFPETEVVVEDRGRYLIVEKFGAAGGVALVTDDRARATVDDRLRMVAGVAGSLARSTHLTLVAATIPCEACGGTGEAAAPTPFTASESADHVACEECEGTGRVLVAR